MNDGPFGREWNAGFAAPAEGEISAVWDMLPANVLDEDEPLDYEPPRRRKVSTTRSDYNSDEVSQ